MDSKTSDFDVGFDLEITNLDSQPGNGGGTWVTGTLTGHCFDALVFQEHAENSEWELGQSRISKLWIQRIADKETVFNWDRGADVSATNEVAGQIVDFLAAGLADHIFAS